MKQILFVALAFTSLVGTSAIAGAATTPPIRAVECSYTNGYDENVVATLKMNLATDEMFIYSDASLEGGITAKVVSDVTLEAEAAYYSKGKLHHVRISVANAVGKIDHFNFQSVDADVSWDHAAPTNRKCNLLRF